MVAGRLALEEYQVSFHAFAWKKLDPPDSPEKPEKQGARLLQTGQMKPGRAKKSPQARFAY